MKYLFAVGSNTPPFRAGRFIWLGKRQNVRQNSLTLFCGGAVHFRLPYIFLPFPRFCVVTINSLQYS
jgi:hypothetical protein